MQSYGGRCTYCQTWNHSTDPRLCADVKHHMPCGKCQGDVIIVARNDLQLGALTRKDYQDAIDIQSAVNSSGVLIWLSNISKKIRNDLHKNSQAYSTEDFNKHPIIVLTIGKLADLAEMNDSPMPYQHAYEVCKAMAKCRVKGDVVRVRHNNKRVEIKEIRECGSYIVVSEGGLEVELMESDLL